MRHYEVMFIVRMLEEEQTNSVIDKFLALIKKNGGVVDKIDRWGKRRLAYEIKDQTEGYYCLFYVNAEPACLKECDRVMKITDELLKHMIVRVNHGPEEAKAEEVQE